MLLSYMNACTFPSNEEKKVENFFKHFTHDNGRGEKIFTLKLFYLDMNLDQKFEVFVNHKNVAT